MPADVLPSGDVVVVHDDTVIPPTYAITVNWTEPGEVMTYAITVPVLAR